MVWLLKLIRVNSNYTRSCRFFRCHCSSEVFSIKFSRYLWKVIVKFKILKAETYNRGLHHQVEAGV